MGNSSIIADTYHFYPNWCKGVNFWDYCISSSVFPYEISFTYSGTRGFRDSTSTRGSAGTKASEGFREGSSDLSMLPLYTDHVVIHIWDEVVKLNCIHSLKTCFFNIQYFWRWFTILQDCDTLKCINHHRKIIGLPKPDEKRSRDVTH